MTNKLLITFGCTFVISAGAQAQVPTDSPAQTPAASAPVVPKNAAASDAPPVWQQSDTSFLKQYPHLAANIYQEPESHLKLGLSAGVLGLVANREIFSGNFFQVHYITNSWDIEGLSVSYALTTAHPSGIRSNHFVFRSIPKFRLSKVVSLGPLVGFEFVSFPDVTAELLSPNSEVTKPEPFSTSGFIYGGAVAETFKLESGLEIRLTQVGYKENYSVTDAGKGWTYFYNSQPLRQDPSALEGGLVFLFEAGILF